MKFEVERSGTTNTYAYCWQSAKRALAVASEQQPGYLYFSMMAGVFAAFTVEAFLNHLGKDALKSWEDVERKLGVREKLLLLRDLRGWTIDEGARPFQSLRDMLQLRDALAHGKTVTVVTSEVLDQQPPDEVGWPKPKWVELASVASVQRFVDDAAAMVRHLGPLAGEAGDPLGSIGTGEGSVALIEAD